MIYFKVLSLGGGTYNKP